MAMLPNLRQGGGWKEFYKADLIKYLQDKGLPTLETDLGREFENIFERWIREEYPEASVISDFRRPGGKWTEDDIRNTEPDFVSDGINTRGVRLYGISAYEVKQQSGALYLSSNKKQFDAHLSNLVHRNRRNILLNGGKPDFTLITTYDVPYASSIAYAAEHQYGVTFTHARSRYKVVKGAYKFDFTKSFFEQIVEFFKNLF